MRTRFCLPNGISFGSTVFAGLACKAAGLGKRADDWDWLDGAEPETDREFDDDSAAEYAAGPEGAIKRRVSTAMRYAGLGKRQRSRVDPGMRYMGVGRRALP